MSIRIAIPEPASPEYIDDAIAYNQRSLPEYLAALHSAGLTPILIPLHETQERVAKILATTVGVLLPGSGADVDPQKYGQSRLPECGDADPARAAVDELLIQDAFNLHKPILAICHGTQAINVWCGGTLIQDIPTQVGAVVDHAPGREVLEAPPLAIIPGTRLAEIASHISPSEDPDHESLFRTPHASHLALTHDTPTHLEVNSSHHQSIATPGDNLVISAISPQDSVIEAVELASLEHWVVAVQWHPERTYIQSAFSRAIFAAFAHATQSWTPRRIEESVLQA